MIKLLGYKRRRQQIYNKAKNYCWMWTGKICHWSPELKKYLVPSNIKRLDRLNALIAEMGIGPKEYLRIQAGLRALKTEEGKPFIPVEKKRKRGIEEKCI